MKCCFYYIYFILHPSGGSASECVKTRKRMNLKNLKQFQGKGMQVSFSNFLTGVT